MVERLAISGDAPLFGRPTVKMKLEALPFTIKQDVFSINSAQKTEYWYMVSSEVPPRIWMLMTLDGMSGLI